MYNNNVNTRELKQVSCKSNQGMMALHNFITSEDARKISEEIAKKAWLDSDNVVI